MTRMGMFVVVTSVALVAWGCGGGTKSFQPAEKATAQSPRGYMAAEYALTTPYGSLGEAKVWSDGASEKDMRGRTETVIHVGFELENHTSQPLSLESLSLDSGTLNRNLVRNIRPVQVQGATTVGPRSVTQFHAYFPMPPDVAPRDVNAFRVHWQIRNDGLTYTQITPFVESQTELYSPVYYYTPFYDPFFYDPYIYHPRIVVVRRPYRHVYVPPPIRRPHPGRLRPPLAPPTRPTPSRH